MDQVLVFGTSDEGSIPSGGTNVLKYKKLYKKLWQENTYNPTQLETTGNS